ncbi:hypothetical protein [Desulfopila sp. IMCC35008]|uniref:hypothetical protein n=1 Tax=Desulfopila sp. IMCC35008 TaxID=2653858 RepID=UPI0013D179C7|nr:hypothetical protein [Desulfopila sp. IMCC35008]
MTTYMLLLLITFCIMVTAALIINYSKQRAGKTRHGLTGMCHESGGEMCSCCSSKYLSNDSRCE